MKKLEIVQNLLHLIEINEMEKANEQIRSKLLEIKQTEVSGIRKEISEIVKSMGVIDRELYCLEFKNSYLKRVCPDNTISLLNDYIQSLNNQRKILAEQKQDLAKSNR